MSVSLYAKVIKGIDLMWNNEFDEAEQLFAAKKDSDPRYALHFAEVSSLLCLVGFSETTHIRS
jgi:hypothetical protein